MTSTRKPIRVRIGDASDSIRRRDTFVAGDGSLTGGYVGTHPVHAARLPADVYASFDAAASSGPLYVVASYGTPIAWAAGPGPLTVPEVRYSVTTSRHQGIARRAYDSLPRCEGEGGTHDPRCGRYLGHAGPCDWCD